MSDVSAAAVSPALFAEIAVEIKVGEISLGELSFAAAILSMMRAENLYRLERIAADCELASPIAHQIILDERRFAGLVAEAHRMFKRMIPHQVEILAMIEAGENKRSVANG
jgi:hypothetical protein